MKVKVKKKMSFENVIRLTYEKTRRRKWIIRVSVIKLNIKIGLDIQETCFSKE